MTFFTFRPFWIIQLDEGACSVCKCADWCNTPSLECAPTSLVNHRPSFSWHSLFFARLHFLPLSLTDFSFFSVLSMFSSVCQFAGSVVSAHPSSPAGVRPVNRHLHPHSGTYGVSVGGRLSPVVGMSSSSSSTTPCTTAAAMLHHHNHHQHSSCASSTSSTLLEHQKECSLCWPSHTYAKSRTIRLRRKDNNTSLGFSIRGGKLETVGALFAKNKSHLFTCLHNKTSKLSFEIHSFEKVKKAYL